MEIVLPKSQEVEKKLTKEKKEKRPPVVSNENKLAILHVENSLEKGR